MEILGDMDEQIAKTLKARATWATSQDAKVAWEPSARWVVDGKSVTSSGVSAGTDVVLTLVQRLYGRDRAMAPRCASSGHGAVTMAWVATDAAKML